MGIQKWLYLMVGAVSLWGQAQSEQFSGSHFYRFAMREPEFRQMSDWRLEFRIHGFRIEPKDHGVVGIEDNPCHFLANSLRMRCRTWQGTSNAVDIDLAGRTDVRVRVQRMNASGLFLVEIWNGDGSGYAASGLRFQPGTYNGQRDNSYIGAFYGRSSELSGAISFVRWYRALLPQQSRPPLDTVAVPGDLLNVDFEGETTRNTSPLRLDLAREGAGRPLYVNTPTYKPVLALQAAYSMRAGQESPLDFGASFASSGDGEIASLVLEQLAGPAPMSIEQNGLVANAFLPVAGTYYLRAVAKDSAGLEATGVAELSATAADSEGRVILADPRVEMVIGPAVRSGASPWPWFDRTEVQLGEALLSAIEPTPGAPLAGKIRVSVGSTRIIGEATRFLNTFKCDGSDNLAVHYPVNAATPEVTGLRVYNIKACASDTELTISPPYDATKIDWRNVAYGRVTNEENARWYNGSNNWNYYDAVLAYYRLYHRTGRDRYREMARTLADRWWKYPLDEGRACENGYWCVAPRVMSLLGLMLRANDGRPELWPPILDLANRNYQQWVASGYQDTTNNVFDIREAGYAYWWQVAIASLHPDQVVREQALQSAEVGFRRFWKPKQLPDGSWRMDIGYACPTCGYEGQGTLPWQLAFPLQGIMALHRLNGDPEVLTSIQKAGDFIRRFGIDGQCRGMYYDVFYTKCPGGNCGQCPFGTCGKYDCEKNGAYNGNDSRTLSNATHSLFGYLYAATGDQAYRLTGDDLFSANLGGTLGGPGADGGNGHYNDAVSGGVPPSFLARTYLSKEFAFVGGAGGAQNYLAWRLGKPPERVWVDVNVPFDLSTVPGSISLRAVVVQPSGTQEVFGCGESPCKVRMDSRQGNHLLVLQFLSEDGTVLLEVPPSPLRLP